jgi:hypothetical protein
LVSHAVKVAAIARGCSLDHPGGEEGVAEDAGEVAMTVDAPVTRRLQCVVLLHDGGDVGNRAVGSCGRKNAVVSRARKDGDGVLRCKRRRAAAAAGSAV